MKNLKTLLPTILLLVSAPIVVWAQSRTGTERAGKSRISAEKIGFDEGQLRRDRVARANVSTADRGDSEWSQWRGSQRDGHSIETGLLDQWPEQGPAIVWQAEGLGSGYSSAAVSQGRVFTLGSVDGREHLFALNEQNGKQLWSTPVGAGDHSNGTPTVDGNRVFAVGLQGDLICADTESGRQLWHVKYETGFGGSMMSGWGFSESPLVDGDLLICTPGAQDAIMAALDKKTGRTVWTTTLPHSLGDRGKDGAGYSSIVRSRAGGIPQYVQLVGKGVIGVRASDGQLLWSYNRVANGTANIPTPIVQGDHVFCSTGYGTGSALLKVNRDGEIHYAEEIYFLGGKILQNHHGGMIRIGDYIYCGHGQNNGFPVCVKMSTGEIIWKPGRGAGSGSAAVACADGHLYFRYEDGVMALIEATPKEYRLKGQFRIASYHGKNWSHPVIAGGKLYLRDQHQLHCYDIARK